MGIVSKEYCKFCNCVSVDGKRCLNGDAHRSKTPDGKCITGGRIIPDKVLFQNK